MYYAVITPELQHHGVKGQKWGVRRYQNEDGSLTSAGRRKQESSESNTKKNKLKKAVKYAAIGAGAAAVGYGSYRYLKNKNTLPKEKMLLKDGLRSVVKSQKNIDKQNRMISQHVYNKRFTENANAQKMLGVPKSKANNPNYKHGFDLSQAKRNAKYATEMHAYDEGLKDVKRAYVDHLHNLNQLEKRSALSKVLLLSTSKDNNVAISKNIKYSKALDKIDNASKKVVHTAKRVRR